MIQYVKVDLNGRAYTYRWAQDPPLKPGELVIVPPNVLVDVPREARVIRILPEPDYPAELIKALLGRAGETVRVENPWDLI